LDIVLGVSMAPSTIRMVLTEGEHADGVTVDEDQFAVNVGGHPAIGAEQVIGAILGTRESVTAAGNRLTSVGITWTGSGEAVELANALAARKIENVMLVSAFLAAAALAQTVGNAIGYEYIAMLLVERDCATLAVIGSADGSVHDVNRRPLRSIDPVAELIEFVAGLNDPEAYPEGLFIVGSDVDITAIKPALEAASSLPVCAPEEPDTALARGAALASATAPLFVSSTAALAYALDRGTGAIDRYAGSPRRRVDSRSAPDDLAHTQIAAKHDVASRPRRKPLLLVSDDQAHTQIAPKHKVASRPRRKPLLLVSCALAVVLIGAALALEMALALGIRPAVALRPSPGQNLVVPAPQSPVPLGVQHLPAQQPQAVQLPALQIPAPAPIADPAPAPVHVPMQQPPANLEVPRAPMTPLRMLFPRLSKLMPRSTVPQGPRFPFMQPGTPGLPHFNFPFPSIFSGS
jgi:hypothetical protein